MTADLQQFVFQGEIGRGAMAVVWRGWDSRLERVVAIKEPLIPAGTSVERATEMASRFVVEGRVAARISHPGLVTIYDADVWDGRAAIVMEYVEGETLSNVIDRSPLPVTSTLVVMDQLLDAVAYAHAGGIIHRDIKPDNVFVTPEGRIKLSDFGVARLRGGKRLTQAGTIVGTPGYMAPEQILGQDVDARADLFSIGVIAYEMLLGGNPFGATDGVPPTDIMRRVVHEDPPPLHGRLTGVSEQLQATLDRALAKRPEDRFQSAQEMLLAFRACANGSGYAPAAPEPAPVAVAAAEPQADAAFPSWASSDAPQEQSADPWADGDLRRAAGLETAAGRGYSQGVWLLGGGGAAVVLAIVLFVAGAAALGIVLLVAGIVLAGVGLMRRESEPASGGSEPRAPGSADGDGWFFAPPVGAAAAAGGGGGLASLRCAVTGPGDSRTMSVALPARIGRAVDAEVSLLDEQASRYHARLFVRDGRVFAEDLGSSNGTYLDGLPLNGEEPLSAGQRLSIGMTTVDILDEGQIT